jgi:uncharacterized protein (DUF1499 family)
MSAIAWLVGLVLPACGFSAAEGLPTPSFMDTATIVRPATPNTALAAPAGFTPAPDVVTQPFGVSAERLFASVQDVAATQARTYPAARYPEQLQAHYVARSAIFNFPDLIMVQVLQSGADSSGLIIYSRSVYGHSDMGVNRGRVDAWLAALKTRLPTSSER